MMTVREYEKLKENLLHQAVRDPKKLLSIYGGGRLPLLAYAIAKAEAEAGPPGWSFS